MRIRCPHCHQPIEVLEESLSGDIICDSCASSFNLVSDVEATESIRAGSKALGHFQLLEKLGVGQFGTVWKPQIMRNLRGADLLGLVFISLA